MILNIIKLEMKDNKPLMPPLLEVSKEVSLGKIEELTDWEITEVYADNIFIHINSEKRDIQIKVSTPVGYIINGYGYVFELLVRDINYLNLDTCTIMVNSELTTDQIADILYFIELELNNHPRGLQIPELLQKIKYEKLSTNQKIKRNELIINGYQHSDYLWRAKPYALQLMNLLASLEVSELTADDLASTWIMLGTYLSNVSLVEKALICFEQAWKKATLKSLKKEALYQIIVMHKHLGKVYQLPYTDEQLVEILGENLSRIKNALEGKGFLKRDPIENTPKFQEVYDQVHERAILKTGENKGMGFCHLWWSTLTDEFAKEGIKWQSPSRCNPKVRFD